MWAWDALGYGVEVLLLWRNSEGGGVHEQLNMHKDSLRQQRGYVTCSKHNFEADKTKQLQTKQRSNPLDTVCLRPRSVQEILCIKDSLLTKLKY